MSARLLYALLFYPVFVLIGAQNSFWIADAGWYRFAFPASTLLLMIYFPLVLKISDHKERMLFLLGAFVCAFGENLCVHALDLYHFAGAASAPYAIPPYVILGHGYAIWTAVVLAREIERRLSAPTALNWLWAGIAAVTVGRMFANGDYAGGVWFPLFLIPYLLSPRRDDKLLLATTYLLATGLELLGVGVRAWEWHESTYYYSSGRFPLHSPPAAVGGFYALADWVALRLLRGFGLERVSERG